MKTKAIEHALDELAHLSPTDTTEVRAELEAMRAESEARLKMLYEKSVELRHEWARAENAEAQLAAKDALLKHIKDILIGRGFTDPLVQEIQAHFINQESEQE